MTTAKQPTRPHRTALREDRVGGYRGVAVILQQSEAARKALEDMVRTGGARIGTLTRFETEVSGEEGERVDLVCFDRNGTKRLLIEAKFWAGLTDNQPNTYIDGLPEHGHSALLFVAPAQRIETLWPELCRRAEANHTLSALSESGDLRCVAIDGSDRKVMLTSGGPCWNEWNRRPALQATGR